MYKLTVNQNAINQASQAIQTLKGQFDALNGRAKETRANLDRKGGMTAIDTMRKALAEIETQKEQARIAARQAVKQARDAFFASIDQQSALDGSQLGADYTLLTGGLVKTEHELQMLSDKHAANPAMRHAIAQYADTKHWNGFAGITTEPTLREFGDTLFAQAERAASDPDSLSGFLLRNTDAIAENQRNYGLTD